MINRIIDIIFVDSLAFVINVTFGTLLHTKICNYSESENIPSDSQLEEISSNPSISQSSSDSENIDSGAPTLSKYSKVNAKMKTEALIKGAS